jgi:hypothetical protein
MARKTLPAQLAPRNAEPKSKSSQPVRGTSRTDQNRDPAESTSRQDLADFGGESGLPV